MVFILLMWFGLFDFDVCCCGCIVLYLWLFCVDVWVGCLWCLYLLWLRFGGVYL